MMSLSRRFEIQGAGHCSLAPNPHPLPPALTTVTILQVPDLLKVASKQSVCNTTYSVP